MMHDDARMRRFKVMVEMVTQASANSCNEAGELMSDSLSANSPDIVNLACIAAAELHSSCIMGDFKELLRSGAP